MAWLGFLSRALTLSCLAIWLPVCRMMHTRGASSWLTLVEVGIGAGSNHDGRCWCRCEMQVHCRKVRYVSTYHVGIVFCTENGQPLETGTPEACVFLVAQREERYFHAPGDQERKGTSVKYSFSFRLSSCILLPPPPSFLPLTLWVETHFKCAPRHGWPKVACVPEPNCLLVSSLNPS